MERAQSVEIRLDLQESVSFRITPLAVSLPSHRSIQGSCQFTPAPSGARPRRGCPQRVDGAGRERSEYQLARRIHIAFRECMSFSHLVLQLG